MTISIASCLLAVSTVALPPVPAVPMPDFKTPVDYIQWYDAATAYAEGNNALGHYGVFLYGDNDQPAESVAPLEDSNAEKELDRKLKTPTFWYPQEHPGLALWVNNTEARYIRSFTPQSEAPYATRRKPDLKLLANIQPPALANGRLIGQMMFLRAWRVADNTIYDNRLIDAVAANLIFANDIGQGATLEEQFFAIGHHAFVYDQIQRSLDSRVHTLPVWQSIIETLEQHDATPLTKQYARSLHFAEATALQLLQHFCMSEGESGPAIAPKINRDRVEAWLDEKYGDSRVRPRNIDTFVNADPVKLAAAIHAYFSGMREVLEAPYVEKLRPSLDDVTARSIGQHPELDLIITPIGLAVESTYHTEAERRLCYLFLKVVMPFKRTGDWPQSLDDLAGPRLATSRIDPFSGKDMRMRRVRDRIMVPYSIGIDGVDNGGDEAADIIYWGQVAPEAQYHTRPRTQPATQPAESPTTQPAETPTTQPAESAPTGAGATTQPAPGRRRVP